MNKPKKLYIITSDSPNMGNNGMSERIFLTIMEVLSQVRKKITFIYLLLHTKITINQKSNKLDYTYKQKIIIIIIKY